MKLFKHAAHLVMIAFAGASLGNVYEFLHSAGHLEPVAWALGMALGASLVIVSILLTHVDRETDPEAFAWLLRTGVVLGLVSGAVQSATYAQHLHLFWALLLGFSVPLGGEVLLAFAVSAYSRARDRERFRNVSVTIESAVADQLENAIAGFDPTTIQKHVERTINSLAKLAVNSVAQKAASYYATDTQEDDSEYAESEKLSAETAQDRVTQMNDARKRKTEERRIELLNILRNDQDASTGMLANALNCSTNTVRSDKNALEERGLLHRNGSK
jgi:hypothetical protein